MNKKDLFRPLVAVDEEIEQDLFRLVQGRVVVVPRNMNERWLNGNIQVLKREIETIDGYVRGKRGLHFGVESFDTESGRLLNDLCETKKHLEMAKLGFPKRLYPSFLSWTRQDGSPVFMVLSWDSPEFILEARSSRLQGDSFTTEPVLPVIVAEQYGLIVDGMLKKLHREEFVQITMAAVYSGQIPATTKTKMVKAKRSGLFSNLLIAAEAPKWQIDRKVVARTDPIVFGVTPATGQTPEMMFMIDIFDPTPLEKAAFEQFALDI